MCLFREHDSATSVETVYVIRVDCGTSFSAVALRDGLTVVGMERGEDDYLALYAETMMECPTKIIEDNMVAWVVVGWWSLRKVRLWNEPFNSYIYWLTPKLE